MQVAAGCKKLTRKTWSDTEKRAVLDLLAFYNGGKRKTMDYLQARDVWSGKILGRAAAEGFSPTSMCAIVLLPIWTQKNGINLDFLRLDTMHDHV